MTTPSTLVHLLQHQADTRGDDLFFRVLLTGDVTGPTVEHSFGSLDREARRIAVQLQAVSSPGERALLLHPPGAECIATFFGCLYAGLVVVPVRPPDPRRLARAIPRLRVIAQDSGARVVLAPEHFLPMGSELATLDPVLAELSWIGTGRMPAGTEDVWTSPVMTPDDLALVRYSTDSDGALQALRASHRDLLAEVEVGAPGGSTNHTVSLLLPTSQIGSRGGLLRPLLGGGGVTLLSPTHVLHRPERWLEAIRHQADAPADDGAQPDRAERPVLREVRARGPGRHRASSRPQLPATAELTPRRM